MPPCLSLLSTCGTLHSVDQVSGGSRGGQWGFSDPSDPPLALSPVPEHQIDEHQRHGHQEVPAHGGGWGAQGGFGGSQRVSVSFWGPFGGLREFLGGLSGILGGIRGLSVFLSIPAEF